MRKIIISISLAILCTLIIVAVVTGLIFLFVKFTTVVGIVLVSIVLIIMVSGIALNIHDKIK